MALFACSAIFLSGCSALAVVNAISPGSETSLQTISYGASERQKIDVYNYSHNPKPAADVATAAVTAAGSAAAASKASSPRHATDSKRPLVIFFYGGSWNSGSKSDYLFVAKALNELGYVVAIPDYRLTPEVLYPEFLKDSAAAVSLLVQRAAEFGGDPEKIILMGHSAGAYNAAMLAFDPRWLSDDERRRVRGYVGLAAPTNFLPIQVPTVQKTFGWPNTARDTQPIEHISSRGPPTLLISAKNDRLVAPELNAIPFIEKLRAAGVSAELELLEGAGLGHASLVATLSPSLRFIAPTLDRIRQFIDRVVR